MTGENSRMDVHDNLPEDLKAMDLSTYNGDITTNLTSKNSESRQKSSGCKNMNVLEAIWKVRSNYRESSDISEETFVDADNIERSTVIGHRMIMYNIIFKEVVMLLPEGSEFKA